MEPIKAVKVSQMSPPGSFGSLDYPTTTNFVSPEFASTAQMSRTDSTGIFEIEGGETSNPLADGAMADEVTGSVNET